MGFVQFSHGLFLLLVAAGANGSDGFKRCYNTSTETHCFEVQYDGNTQAPPTSADDARRRCSQIGATLVVIKNEEVNLLFMKFKRESGNPITDLNGVGQNVWTDAVRIDDYNNTYTWHWINKTLPNIPASDVLYTNDSSYYVAALELRPNGQYYITANVPQESNNYVCDYNESNCSSVVKNSKTSDGRCYIAYNENVTWFEARNRCLMKGGDLASFRNVKNFNFSSLFDFGLRGCPPKYWIGLRLTWYIWNVSGTEIRYLLWVQSYNPWSTSRCLALYSLCNKGCAMAPRNCNNTHGNIYTVCQTVRQVQVG